MNSDGFLACPIFLTLCMGVVIVSGFAMEYLGPFACTMTLLFGVAGAFKLALKIEIWADS